MEIFDVAIILILVIGFLLGFKRGFTKSVVCFASVFLSIIIAFLLKNNLSIIFYENLPFFKFGGILKGVTVLNIFIYEIIAFLLLLLLITIIFKILILATSIFEKILNATIILGIPSKILGGVVGIIEYYVITFILLFVLTLPVFSFNSYILDNCKYAEKILLDTPILSNFTDDTLDVINEFTLLKTKYKESTSSMQFNKETLDLFLKYKIITIESVDKLIEKDKLKIDAVEEILKCYREETKNECERNN